jgi:hypothetical protein
MSTNVAPQAKTPTPAPFKKLPLTPDGKLVAGGTLLQSPRTMVVISFPKSGKTDNMIGVPKILIGDCEDGTAYFEGTNFVNLKKFHGENPYYLTKTGGYIPAGLYETCSELYRANNMKEFNALYDELQETKDPAIHKQLVKMINEMPFPIFVVDTLTSFIKLVYDAALAEYNSDKSPEKQKTDIKRTDNFGGAQHIRRAVEDIKAFIEKNAAPFIVYNGHIKMKKAVLKKTDEEVSVVDMALEGQLPLIFTSSSAAVATFYRDEEGCFLDFQKKSEDDRDARPRHLGNQVIKVADLHEYAEKDGMKVLVKKGETYWNRIFPEIQF